MKNGKSEGGLFSHPEVLEETTEERPLDYQKSEIEKIKNYTIRQIKKNRPKIVAYLAPYGSGKSVILNNVLNELPEGYNKIQFDIWQCSDKKDIWESFLIKVLSELKHEAEKKIINRIDGTKIRWISLVLFFLCYLGVSFIAWFLLKDYDHEPARFLRAFLIYAAPVFLALAGINKFFPVYESKMKTLAQYKEELNKVIKNNNRPTVVVIEDVDRSGNGGQRFLETLKCFLGDVGDRPILVLCPQRDYSFGNIMYREDDNHWDSVAKLENSIKIYDDVVYGSYSGKVTGKQALQLMESAGCHDEKLVETIKLTILACSNSSLLTMRSLKFLLRNVLAFIEANESADPSAALFFLSRRFLDARKGVGSNNLTDSIFRSGISLSSGGDDRERDLVCHVFDIDLNMYRDAARIQFEYMDSVPEKGYKTRRHVDNKRWVVCCVDRKYQNLAKSNEM